MTLGEPGSAAAAREEIAREVARVHLESYGEQATNVRVAVTPEMVAVMMDVDLAAGERTLVEAGMADSVRRTREVYQEVIESVFVAIIERATGRRVVGFAGSSVLGGPVPWEAEIFRLADPEAAGEEPLSRGGRR